MGQLRELALNEVLKEMKSDFTLTGGEVVNNSISSLQHGMSLKEIEENCHTQYELYHEMKWILIGEKNEWEL